MRLIDEIIIHCTATSARKKVTIDEIDRWHRDRKMKCIGYHFVIHQDGSISEGRPLSDIGAHCKQHNLNSIGIAYVGGLNSDTGKPEDTRTQEQRDSLFFLIERLVQEYPIQYIVGHNKYANKACPCFDAELEYLYLTEHLA